MRIVLATACGVTLFLAACAPAAQPSPTPAPAKPPAKPAATAAPAKPAATAAPAKAAEKPARPAEVERLLAAARANGENELSLSWSEDNYGGAEGAKRFEALFNRLYGTSIKVNFTPGPGFADSTAKISQEVAAGQKAYTDVIPGASPHFGAFVSREVLEEYDYTQLSPRISKEFVAPRNIGVEILSQIIGVPYNTSLVSQAEVPKKLEDVLDPKWRGKIAAQPSAGSLPQMAFHPDLGFDKLKALVRRLAENSGGLIRGNELERIASGEFAMLVVGNGAHTVKALKAQGAPLGHVVLQDGPVVNFNYMGVPRTAPHPNLAKLFVAMPLSEEGQKVLYENELIDHYALPGSQSAAELGELRAGGVSILRVDAKHVADHPEVQELQTELQAILRGGR